MILCLELGSLSIFPCPVIVTPRPSRLDIFVSISLPDLRTPYLRSATGGPILGDGSKEEL